MKLSEYLYKKIYAEPWPRHVTIEIIEEWIKEYNERLNKNRIPLKYETK